MAPIAPGQVLSQSARVGLPRTRSFRRRRPLRLWWVAVAIALLSNIAVVIGLSQVSHLHVATIAPPLAVRTIRQVESEEMPPLPAETPRQENDVAAESLAPTAVALPSLELPSVAPLGALALPAVGSIDPDVMLPVAIPAFAVFSSGAVGEGSPPAMVGAGGPPAFDTPAERESTFDLDRYYPRAARVRGIAGSTRLRISITAQGRVSNVEIMESTPAGVFDDAALRLANAMRYRPAQSAGKPVASEHFTSIEWTLRK